MHTCRTQTAATNIFCDFQMLVCAWFFRMFISSYARQHVFRFSFNSSWQRLCNTCMSQSTAKNKIIIKYYLVLYVVHIMYRCIHLPLLLLLQLLSGYFSLTIFFFLYVPYIRLHSQHSKSSNNTNSIEINVRWLMRWYWTPKWLLENLMKGVWEKKKHNRAQRGNGTT